MNEVKRISIPDMIKDLKKDLTDFISQYVDGMEGYSTAEKTYIKDVLNMKISEKAVDSAELVLLNNISRIRHNTVNLSSGDDDYFIYFIYGGTLDKDKNYWIRYTRHEEVYKGVVKIYNPERHSKVIESTAINNTHFTNLSKRELNEVLNSILPAWRFGVGCVDTTYEVNENLDIEKLIRFVKKKDEYVLTTTLQGILREVKALNEINSLYLTEKEKESIYEKVFNGSTLKDAINESTERVCFDKEDLDFINKQIPIICVLNGGRFKLICDLNDLVKATSKSNYIKTLAEVVRKRENIAEFMKNLNYYQEVISITKEMSKDITDKLSGLINSVDRVIVERALGNTNQETFDFITVILSLPTMVRYNDKELLEKVKESKDTIIKFIMLIVSGDKSYKQYNIPVKYLKIDNMTVTKQRTLVTKLSIKELPKSNKDKSSNIVNKAANMLN